MKNFIAILVFSFLLTGCIPFFSLFPNWSWLAADGASYISTGKSTKDHALSFAMDQDCALFRVINGENICAKSNDEIADIMYDLDCHTYSFNEYSDPFCRNEKNRKYN
tara:strand:- start:125 stop:448 length:324 start_codon:yes stop_codon:yes gene_type:complete